MNSIIILKTAGINKKNIDTNKKDIYYQILQYLDIEGYSTKASSDFKKVNISELVLCITGSVFSAIGSLRIR